MTQMASQARDMHRRMSQTVSQARWQTSSQPATQSRKQLSNHIVNKSPIDSSDRTLQRESRQQAGSQGINHSDTQSVNNLIAQALCRSAKQAIQRPSTPAIRATHLASSWQVAGSLLDLIPGNGHESFCWGSRGTSHIRFPP